MDISIIIPTYNEEDTIAELLEYLKKHSNSQAAEIIVVDGESTDNTVCKAKQAGVCCLTSAKCRGAQLNVGAAHATGDVFYFVHADSYPPPSFLQDIKKSISEGHPAGCYRFQFNSDHPLLKINSYMTRFNRLMCRGGDQTLYITRRLFRKLDGYRDDYIIMEDFEFIERIQETANFKIIPKEVTVSARKYEQNNYLKVQLANFIIFMMYFCGCSQEKLFNTYKKLLTHPKF